MRATFLLACLLACLLAYLLACSQGNLPLARLLVERGAAPTHRVCNEENVWYTPAIIARQHGHDFVAEYIDAAVTRHDPNPNPNPSPSSPNPNFNPNSNQVTRHNARVAEERAQAGRE